MMNDTLKAALMSDIHKAMGASGLVPVKRMIRGKYGVYFAIRWVRPGDEQKGDIPLKKPTPQDYAQADAEATPEKASKLIDGIKVTDPREMREEIAKMLQSLGGGHDAHHAILEALEAKGVQFENTGNVLTTWSNALEPMMNYIKGRNQQRTPEPEPHPQKEEPQPEPQKEESSPEQQQHELKGSEKQIKWATEIRDRMLDTFGKYRDYAKDKNPDEVALIDSLTTAINNATDAKTFINLFKDFHPKGDMEQDVKNLYDYYRTAVKYASADDEKRLVQPLVDVWNKYEKEKKEEQPQTEPAKPEPEPEKPAMRNIGGVNFKDEGIFTPSLSQYNRPDDDALRGIIAKQVQKMRKVGANPVVSNIMYSKVDDLAYRSSGIYTATVEYTVSSDKGDRRVKNTITLPPFGKDAETVSIRGNKFALRLFQENSGRSAIQKISEDDNTNYNALPIEHGKRAEFDLLPEYIQQQLTTQAVIPLVAKAIATRRGVMYSPEMKQPFVVYNLSFGGYDESGTDAEGNMAITVHAECRGENDFETQGQYEILLNVSDLNIMSKEEWEESETAKKINALKPQIEDMDDLIQAGKQRVSRLDSEYRRLQKEEADLGTKQGYAYSQIQSKMSSNRAQRKLEQEQVDSNQAERDKLQAQYDEYFNAEKPQEEIPGQRSFDDEPEPKNPEQPQEEPEPEQPQESSEEEQARLKAEDEARRKKIGAKNSYQGLTLNTNAVARIEGQLAANNQELRELNLLRISDGEIRLIATVNDSITGKQFKKPMYLKNGEGRDKFLDSPTDTASVSMDSSDAVVNRIKSVPNYEDTKNGGMVESAFTMFADSTAKGYKGITAEQARMFRGTAQSLFNYTKMYRDGTYKEEADKASVPWKGAVQTARIIDKCELSHDSVARKQMRVSDFVDFFGLNPDDFREPGERLTADKFMNLRGYSFKSNNFVNAYGSFGNYPSLGDGELDVEFLLPRGSKAAMIDPFKTYGHVERGNSLTWSGSMDYDKAEFTKSNHNSGGILIQRGSTFQIMKITEESGGVGSKQYRAYVLVGEQDPWSMEPHGKPPEDWSLDKPIYWEG